MTFSFDNKTVFILSPERWGIMKVSKHHYAIELAERGNQVYFIEPPDLEGEGIKVEPMKEYGSLYVVTYKPLYRGERFLPEAIYRWLIRTQVKRLVRALGGPPDVLWSFYPYHFRNLDWFGAKVKILHMMDISVYSFLPPETSSADICFGVTDSLVKFLQPSGRPVYFINHGLSKRFINSNTFNGQTLRNGRPLTVGYVGNLLTGALDRDTMSRVIREHPELRFVFWGQYKVGQDKLDAYRAPESIRFSEEMQAAPNVVLRGPIRPEDLSGEIKEADCFWLCYKKEAVGIWEGSNSHKLLEYLITGKPVITHKVETYEGYEDILYMVKDMHNDNYPALFGEVVGDLDRYSSDELQKKRMEMALSNSYENHIKFIESRITENGFYK